jgi:hypothetical protein
LINADAGDSTVKGLHREGLKVKVLRNRTTERLQPYRKVYAFPNIYVGHTCRKAYIWMLASEGRWEAHLIKVLNRSILGGYEKVSTPRPTTWLPSNQGLLTRPLNFKS